jgi:hypothetical protein
MPMRRGVRRSTTAIAAALAACALLSACGMAEGPREKLQRTAFAFNEGLRWGRDAEVLPRVDPAALAGFQALHAGWGGEVQISGVEILQSVVDKKLDKAVLTVKYTWYRQSEMVVNDTVTLQHWERRKGEWWMVAEQYQSGTPL